MKIGLETITPDLARRYIDSQVENRNVREARVKQWAQDMSRGEFPATAQPIMFDTAGRLIDGQHRLHAIILADIPVDLMVARDVPAEHRRYIDGGAPRTAADVLHMQHGLFNRNEIVAAAKLVLLYHSAPDKTWRGTSQQPSKQSVVDEVIKNIDVYEVAAREGRRATSTTGSGRWLTKSSFAALSILVGRYSNFSELWLEFHDGVSTGANLSLADPRLALRSSAITAGRYHSGQWSLLACLRSWNAYVEGKELQIIRTGHPRYLPMPEVF